MNRTTTMIAGLWLLVGCSLAVAQEAEQQKLLAKRAATADAYRKLAECVYGLQINSTTRVQDFVVESDDIATELDTMIRGIRVGEPTFYPDGSCEVPAEVTVAKIVRTLREAHERHYDGDTVRSSDFESMKEEIKKDVIKVVGLGGPREELPPGLPEGVREMLGGPEPDLHPSLPEIWQNVPFRARRGALEVARKDAQRQLAERIKGLRLTADTRVRDFVLESDRVTTELSAFLRGSRETQVYYHDDELIVEVTMMVPTEQVITAIKQLHVRHYDGDDVEGMDIEKIAQKVIKRDFEATGMGIPTPKYMTTVQLPETAVTAPGWAAEMITAEGEATDPEFDTAQGRLKATRAAEVDARRKLAERLAGLQLQAETEVEDFVLERDEIQTYVDAILVDSYVLDTRFTSDSAVVKVGVPGARVWSILGDELRLMHLREQAN